jgi:hypothetical protein
MDKYDIRARYSHLLTLKTELVDIMLSDNFSNEVLCNIERYAWDYPLHTSVQKRII